MQKRSQKQLDMAVKFSCYHIIVFQKSIVHRFVTEDLPGFVSSKASSVLLERYYRANVPVAGTSSLAQYFQ